MAGAGSSARGSHDIIRPGAWSYAGNTSGCLWTRTFATGTKVFEGQYIPPATEGRNLGSCIYWSDGSVTSPNASWCMPKDAF